MTAVEIVLNQPASQAIGWALVHFVWQGALIAAATALLLAALRRSAADVRYVVATIGLVLMVTMPLVTGVQTWRAARSAGLPSRASAPDALRMAETAADATARGAGVLNLRREDPAMRDAAHSVSTPIAASIAIEPWMPTLLAAWLCGVTLLTLRLASGWLWVQRLRTRNASPARSEWVLMAQRLSRRLHISRSIRLLESTLVEVPTVIGSLRPVILLPASALSGLSPVQLEAILAHELAHIRRHDYLVNLLQTLVETLLFYHPAVWWLSHRIRIERENCCDDLAVSLCGDPYTYASALADLEQLRGSGQLVVAATGGSLLQRVRRLLGAPSHEGRSPGWLAGGVAVLVMVAMAAGAIGNEVLRGQSKPATTAVRAVAESSVRRPALSGPASPGLKATAYVPPPASATDEPAAPPVALPLAPHPAPAVAAAAPPAPAAAPAAAPAPVPDQTGVRIGDSGRRPRGNYSWSNDGERFDVSYDGEIEFTEDDSDVRSITPGGFLKLSDGGWFGGRGVEFRADASGNITRRFRVGIVEKPFEPEGRLWLSQKLPRFIRQSALGASTRVARIMKAKGPAGVLAEISLIDGSYAKRIYFTELLKTASLDPALVRQALMQAGREIKSDHDLATLLISSRHLLLDDSTRKVYFDAAASIQGDYEMRRVLSAGLKTGIVPPAILISILNAAASIQGDYEQASLLVEIAKQQPLDATTGRAFFAALDHVGGAYERGRVLSALAARPDLSPDMVAAMLRAIATTRSDYEQGQFLIKLARQRPIDAALRTPFFNAVDTLNSSYERGRVLQTLAKRVDTPPDTIVAVIRSAGGMSSHHDKSQVLLAVASTHPISGAAREAYLAAADNLGEYEQGRVLSALMRNERGRK